MKKFIPLLLAVFVVTLASCEKDPDMDKLDNNYLVYTNYDKKADFKTFETYYLPDSILVIGDKENAEYWKDENAQEILSAYVANMNSRGYIRVDDREEADLGLQVSYVRSTYYFTDYGRPEWWWNYPATGMLLLGQLGRMVLSLCRELFLQHRFLYQRIVESGGAARPERETSCSVDQLYERLAEWFYFCQYQTCRARCEPSFHSINLPD